MKNLNTQIFLSSMGIVLVIMHFNGYTLDWVQAMERPDIFELEEPSFVELVVGITMIIVGFVVTIIGNNETESNK